jgi:cyclopropane fatty-acyl-phospholipid synthase-like methyltransferase
MVHHERVTDLSAVNSKEIVRTGYDRVSGTYRGDRFDLTDPEQMKYAGWIEELKIQLGPGGDVLDLGCGNGVPVAQLLVQAGYGYVGVDLSPVQIERARRLTPHAEFICGDMSERFSAVASLYAMIHLPLEEQRGLLKRIHQWLQPGGVLMIIVGATEWTGVEEDWLGVPGVTMYWSHADLPTYQKWLVDCEFEMMRSRFVPEGEGGHVLVMARKAQTTHGQRACEGAW